MLRLLVLLLLLANGAYYAWSRGLLAAWGQAPAQQSEPHRVGQQLRPEALRIVGADEARRIEAAATAPSLGRPTECLVAGPLEDGVVTALRTTLAGWPINSWSLEPAVEPARWIVYMGKYPAADAVERKKAELRQLGVSFEPLSNTSLEPGLSLGGFTSQAAAEQQMATLAQRGVRTAKVVQERPEERGQMLRLPVVDDGLRPRLDELKAPLSGRPLRPCR